MKNSLQKVMWGNWGSFCSRNAIETVLPKLRYWPIRVEHWEHTMTMDRMKVRIQKRDLGLGPEPILSMPWAVESSRSHDSSFKYKPNSFDSALSPPPLLHILEEGGLMDDVKPQKSC